MMIKHAIDVAIAAHGLYINEIQSSASGSLPAITLQRAACARTGSRKRASQCAALIEALPQQPQRMLLPRPAPSDRARLRMTREY